MRRSMKPIASYQTHHLVSKNAELEALQVGNQACFLFIYIAKPIYVGQFDVKSFLFVGIKIDMKLVKMLM